MTEIPEHLLKRSRERREALGTQDGASLKPFDGPYSTREQTLPNEATEAQTLQKAIDDIRSRFGVDVVSVPVDLPVEDAEGILNAFAPLGDLSPEFISNIAEVIRIARS